MNKNKLSIIVLITGILLGGVILLITTFVNKARYNEAYKEAQKKVQAAEARLVELQKEYDPLKEQYELKSQECDNISMSSSNWFADKNKCMREQSELYTQISELEMEATVIRNTRYTAPYDDISFWWGLGVMIAGLGGALLIYLFGPKKEM